MNITIIIMAAVLIGVLGLLIGLLLGVAEKKFKVETDEREVLVRELLPGSNCGGCGYAGCDGLAQAIVAGEAPVNGCPVGGAKVSVRVGLVMGISVSAEDKKVAYVKCAGTCDKTERKYDYYGLHDCRQAVMAPGKGEKVCTFSCMGYGTCVTECGFDAIHIVNGIAVVDPEKCVACGKCVSACPKSLIDLIPEKSTYKVQCNSHDKGKDVKAACQVGCIGCGICVKQCEVDAITVTDGLAAIDYEKCTGCGKCAAKCPVKIIEKK